MCNLKDSIKTEMTCLTLKIEPVFLSRLDGEPIYQSIKQKVENREKLKEEELMQLIILPLTDKGKEKKQEAIIETRNATRLEAQKEFAIRMLELDIELVQIMKVTGLTRKQINVIKESISVAN